MNLSVLLAGSEHTLHGSAILPYVDSVLKIPLDNIIIVVSDATS